MNPNGVFTQQQTYMKQVMQNAQQTQWLYLMGAVVAMAVHFGLVYLFYARLSDIATELLKLRVAFEMAEDRKARAAGAAARSPSAASGENPFAIDERYKSY